MEGKKKAFYRRVIAHRKPILIGFLAAAVCCLFLNQLVGVNYDMNDYLPEDTHSTISLTVMQEEFDGGIPNARVMIRDVTVPEALEYKEKLERVDGVLSVTWLDDAVDLTLPLPMLDEDTVENYYKDQNALFSVTIAEDSRISAVEDIRAIIGEENAMTGDAVSTATATKNTVSEIRKMTVIAVVFVLLVLILTTGTWAEPLIILGGLGVAIVINSGTNLIFGEISFVTNAAGSILQLAVSLDYSVFLIHRFDECRETNPNVEDAMLDALCKSTASVLSSGLTTVIGFLALVLMQFRIGPDLGLALAKGVAISLITVFVFMPALILSTYRLTDKTRHKPFLPAFRRFGKAVRRVSVPLVCVFALLVIPAYLASNANEFYYGSSRIFGEDTQFGADTAAIEEAFGANSTYVLLVPKNDTATQTALSDELHGLDHVTGIISYVDTAGAEIPAAYLDEETLSQLVSENYSRMVLSADVPAEGDEGFALTEQLRTTAEKYYPGSYYLAGEGVSTYDLMETVTADMVKVNLVAIAAVFLVLLLTLRSLTLPILLVLSIETAIWLNLAVPYFTDSPIFYIAYLIISSVQLGATVDYAILMTDRYKENRRSMDKKTAAAETVSEVAVSILTSGSVLTVVGLLLGYLSSNQLLAQLGIFIGRGAIFSLVIVLFVLPGLLYLFDRLVIRQKNRKKILEADHETNSKM
ncbi:MAG: MMPL family transporter [Lachnospiraceae bacterium]|nr:MMPL family transporter [Lachnospiraceae bacterium]